VREEHGDRESQASRDGAHIHEDAGRGPSFTPGAGSARVARG
jgi:hypothetical protein